MQAAQLSVSVSVQPLPEQTAADQGVWAYAYTVEIVNTGSVAAQVIARHWHISDSQGRIQQVDGLALVGHQPLLQPGERFQYSSWARIGTAQGSMKGRLLCVSESADVFYTEVSEFALADSTTLH